MSLTWLHVSDFHFKAGDPYDRDVVLRDPSSCARRLIELFGLTDVVERPRDPAPAHRLDALSSWVAVPSSWRATDGGKVR